MVKTLDWAFGDMNFFLYYNLVQLTFIVHVLKAKNWAKSDGIGFSLVFNTSIRKHWLSFLHPCPFPSHFLADLHPLPCAWCWRGGWILIGLNQSNSFHPLASVGFRHRQMAAILASDPRREVHSEVSGKDVCAMTKRHRKDMAFSSMAQV